MTIEQRTQDLKQCGLSTREAEAQARQEMNNANAEMAQRGRNAIDAYRLETGHERECALRDLLADLMHMAAEDDIEMFEDELQAAREHFNTERKAQS
jgi:predicted kinase